MDLHRQGGAAACQGSDATSWRAGFSPSGTFEQDDMDNWQECTRTCRGVVTRVSVEHADGTGARAVRRQPPGFGQRFPHE